MVGIGLTLAITGLLIFDINTTKKLQRSDLLRHTHSAIKNPQN